MRPGSGNGGDGQGRSGTSQMRGYRRQGTPSEQRGSVRPLGRSQEQYRGSDGIASFSLAVANSCSNVGKQRRGVLGVISGGGGQVVRFFTKD